MRGGRSPIGRGRGRAGWRWRRRWSTSRSAADARVLELGCGLGAPSVVAARSGAAVLATDGAADAVAFAAHALALNEVVADVAVVDWAAQGEALVELGPFDVVLAADVLYTRANVETALRLWPRLLAPTACCGSPTRSAPGRATSSPRRAGRSAWCRSGRTRASRCTCCGRCGVAREARRRSGRSPLVELSGTVPVNSTSTVTGRGRCALVSGVVGVLLAAGAGSRFGGAAAQGAAPVPRAPVADVAAGGAARRRGRSRCRGPRRAGRRGGGGRGARRSAGRALRGLVGGTERVAARGRAGRDDRSGSPGVPIRDTKRHGPTAGVARTPSSSRWPTSRCWTRAPSRG